MKTIFCTPTVFVIGNDYEITVYTNAFGLCFLKIGDEIFSDTKAGVMRSETRVHKFRIKQEILDRAKEYEVIFRGTIARKSYSSTFSEAEHYKYSFKPVLKTENIKAYYISDSHYKFNRALACAKYFGEDTDFYIVNGDIGDEIAGEEQFRVIAEFLSNLAHGEKPVLFVRGNHETKGGPAEKYGKYFPLEKGNSYFTFKLGVIGGVALDLGEDKPDSSLAIDSTPGRDSIPPEFIGLNRFSDYRKMEADFLESIELDGKIKFAVSHIAPSLITINPNNSGKFENEAYTRFSKALDRAGVQFLISGHHHSFLLLPPNDERSTAPHDHPVIVGSFLSTKTGNKEYVGTALIISPDKTEVFFTDTNCTVKEHHVINH